MSPQYVIAAADHLAHKTELSTEGFHVKEANSYLTNLGFSIEIKPQKTFQLSVTAERVSSTVPRFTMDNLALGDNDRPLDAYFQRNDGEIIRRVYRKNEKKRSNQTLPRIACQVFESQLAELSAEGRESFPVCRYTPNDDLYRGIFPSVKAYRKYHNSIEYLTYPCSGGSQFVFYSWNSFSTILFVQEYLKRFGAPGDRFVLVYREKNEDDLPQPSQPVSAPEELPEPPAEDAPRDLAKLAALEKMLIDAKNLIFHGAPGTGKSYLAKELAAYIISGGRHAQYDRLTKEQKTQVAFVQFHPSYDYADFVEGLRPQLNADGTMGFDLRDGIFKQFVSAARTNCENAQKSRETAAKERSVQETMAAFFSNLSFGADTFQTITGNTFTVTGVDEEHINVLSPETQRPTGSLWIWAKCGKCWNPGRRLKRSRT